ncbi:MAG: FAD-linked oxidase C-terminal domain-containing protein [Nakamurella sp.]
MKTSALMAVSTAEIGYVQAPGTGRRRWLLNRLQEVLGSAEISFLANDLEAMATDRSGHRLPGRPLAVLRPTSIPAVQAALKVANTAQVTVVPRGAGTGLSGAASVPDGALVLSTEGLNRIVRIDPDNEIAVVQPGVITAELDAAAAEHGLMYAPDPASYQISTIGGNIATNAGGLHCVKYGVTRESVLGLTVVLADGTLLRTGRQTIKGVVGYDLTALFVGSEGTLGVVVEATVRLRPRPVKTRTAVAFFASTADAASGLTAIVRSRVQPSVLELLDAGTLAGIDVAQGTDLASRGSALLIIQTDGYGADGEIEAIGAAAQQAGGTVEYPDDAAGERYLWLRRHGRGYGADHWLIGEDIAVPRSALAAMLAAIDEIGARRGLHVAVVAHAGDGNLHPLFSLPKQAGDGLSPPTTLLAGADELVRAALELGGTISGEHGVGITKRPWIAQELGDGNLALQRRLKAAFDPLGILNPHTWLAEAAPADQHSTATAVPVIGRHR